MARRLLNLVTALSMLLCVAVVVLWVRSYWVTDCFQLADASDYTAVVSSRGIFLVRRDVLPPRSPNSFSASAMETYHWSRRPPEDLAVYLPSTVEGEWNLFGLSLSRGRWLDADRRLIVIPAWPLAAILALASLPGIRARLVARRATVQHLCPSCGYDLRATPGKCPECGTPTATSP